MNLKFYINDQLRFVAESPLDLKNHIAQLKNEIKLTTDNNQKVSLLGEVAVYLDRLNILKDSELLLNEALHLIEEYNLGIKKTIQQKIRLATVIQHTKNFSNSNIMFDEIISTCRNNSEADVYLDYSLQHAGKNIFDQTEYEKALLFFEEALFIRKRRRAPSEQIISTEFAIKTTKKRIDLKVR